MINFLLRSRRSVPALPSRFFLVALALASLGAPAGRAAESDEPATKAVRPVTADKFGAWVEQSFPFFSSVLDARRAGESFPKNNLTPRGIVLNLGHDCWLCFDPDLLRVAAVWRGRGVTPKALAPGSYHDVSRKTGAGEVNLPEPDGKLWFANGIYPGWQVGDTFSPEDPREPAPSPEEVGRGALPESLGRFNALRLVNGGVVLDYTVGGAAVREWTTASENAGQAIIQRDFSLAASPRPLRLVLGTKAPATGISLGIAPGTKLKPELTGENGIWTIRVPAHTEPLAFAITLATGSSAPILPPRPIPTEVATSRWPQEITTAVKLSTAKDAYVVDHIELPQDNVWQRAVRPGDIQFLKDGTGVVITLDGDVWLVHGLTEASGTARWKRFASGLHEPMTIAIRDDQIFAFDKNGIWRLRDTNGDGEADVHELFSNAFAQTADNREFPATIRLAPKGEFVIAKGNQQATTLGKHNGSVLRISADGREATVLGYGFRQPNLSVNLRTGLVIASDQQGNYVPATPLHIVRDHQFYGFLAPFQPREQYPAPIADPLTWIPHPVNSSALSQVWLFGAKMGPLNDQLVHIGFNKPELFRVLFNSRGTRPQAAVVSVTRAFEFPPLNGSVNPADGQLYIAGFQILGWGNVIDVAGGLGRVRYTGAPVTIAREVVPMDKGVLIRFEVPLDPKKATDPASYSLQSWGYQRTYKYGSPQYKADGTPGQDALPASSAYLSQDGRSVFIGVPNLKPVMQLRVGWSLATAEGTAFDANAYTTPYELAKFDPKAEGFGDITVDLTPRAVVAQASGPVSLDEGKRLAQLFACVACHADEYNPAIAKSGPPWKGLFGKERTVFVGGKPTKVLADEAYLRESMLEPTAKIASGYEKSEFAMPSFAGVLNDSQVESLILYIKSLK